MLKLYYSLQQEKLEDYKLNHKAEEEGLEDEIADLEDKLTEVKATLEKRKERLEQVRIQFKKKDSICNCILAGNYNYFHVDCMLKI